MGRMFGTLGLLAIMACYGRAAEKLVIASHGRTNYNIVLSAREASPSERFAAQELASFLHQMTNAEFPVVTDEQAGEGPHIFVGDSSALRKVAPGLDVKGLGREGYVVQTVGAHLILAGGRMRGSMYAVYDLLEDHLGCRWFTPDCSRIPRYDVLELEPLRERKIPPLEYREDFIAEAFDGLWAVRNRMNGNSHRISPEQGDRIHYVGFVHTFYPLLAPEKYFKDHPEYYALVGGQRRAENAQLCLTNPDVVRLVTEEVRRWLRDAKARGLPDDVIVSVSQNDCWGWCECPKCAAVVKEEGSQSGPILRFVNQVADAIKDEFPLAAIDTLAYSYSRKPPLKVRPRPNVIVRLCSIECCFSHPLDGCPVNKSFMDDLRGWQKICKRLYVWDYVTDFAHYIMPFPNLRVLGPNLKTFVAHNVRGVFEEGNYHGGGELAYLRAYMLAKALWDPNYDMDRAMNEFLEAYYDFAAPYIRHYIDLMHDTVERENIHVFIWTGPTEKYLRPEILAEAERLFDAAEAAVRPNQELLLHVRQARMPIMYARLAQSSPRYRLRDGRFVAEAGAQYARVANNFADLATALGISNISEGRRMSAYLQSLQRGFPELPLLTIASKDLRLGIIPARGGRIFSMFDRVLQRELMHRVPEDHPLYPGGSGYTDFIGTTWPGPGSEEPWEVVEQTDLSVTLRREADGYRQERRIELDPASPGVTITVTVQNLSAEPRETLVRLHPDFTLGRVDDCVVEYQRRGGGEKRWALSESEPTEKDTFLDGTDMPTGWWRAVNTKFGFGLECEFDPDQVSRCLLNYNRDACRVNLELYSRDRNLKPGESLTVRYVWRVIRGISAARKTGQ